ncbi:MAG: ATP-binding cassette domain-containing protein, partial [Bdellovibrio sp.]
MSYIELQEVSVNALNVAERAKSLRERLLGKKKGEAFKVPILKNINFKAQTGERIGVVGLNGSGKSSLLKAIAGIYPIDEGHMVVKGSVVPLIEMGVGFDPEVTGRQNIRLALIYSGKLDLY